MSSTTTRPASLPRSGDVFFPLASNAKALITGGPMASVRARLKVASLVYDRVLVEAGRMDIQAGPSGSSALRMPHDPNAPAAWQTPLGRKAMQGHPFSIAMAPESTPGVPATEPYHTVVQSETSISWQPTFEPFTKELPSGCDWIHFGRPGPVAPQFEQLGREWERQDDRNEALERLVSERFVRSALIKHVNADLVVGAAAGWDISVDPLHGQVVAARFASDTSVTPHSFALPVLVPRVTKLDWEDIARIRQISAIGRLREVLREVETEAIIVANEQGDLEEAVRRVYEKVRNASEHVESLGSAIPYTLTEFVVGTGAGGMTAALAMAATTGTAVAASVSATVMGGIHFAKAMRRRRQRAWLGVMSAISEAAS